MNTLLKSQGMVPGDEASRKTLGKALVRVQQLWKFSNVEMARLLHLKANTYGNWMKRRTVPLSKPPFSPETELVLTLLAVFRSLGSMFDSAEDQILWLRAGHPDLGGVSPLEFAQKSCENFFQLKHYLDYVRGRGA